MPLIDHFSLIARFYDRASSSVLPPDRLLKLLDMCGECSVLDAGGGTGRVSAGLASPERKVVVADESPGMLQQAHQKGVILAVRSHAEKLPFDNETFERVIMVDALHHVIDQQRTAQEMWRVLKPGGRIVIEEPDLRTMTVKLLALGEKLLLMRTHFLSPPCIEALFHYPDARVRTEVENKNAWVVIDKSA